GRCPDLDAAVGGRRGRQFQTKSVRRSSTTWVIALNRCGGITMKRAIALLAAIAVCAVPAYALYEVSFKGEWPNTWPKELEPLRKQSRTLVGPEVENRHFAIPFAKREEFESAWPHILKVKSKGA